MSGAPTTSFEEYKLLSSSCSLYCFVPFLSHRLGPVSSPTTVVGSKLQKHAPAPLTPSTSIVHQHGCSELRTINSRVRGTTMCALALGPETDTRWSEATRRWPGETLRKTPPCRVCPSVGRPLSAPWRPPTVSPAHPRDALTRSCAMRRISCRKAA